METPKSNRQASRGGLKAPEIIFANWREMLNRLRLGEALRRNYTLAIEGNSLLIGLLIRASLPRLLRSDYALKPQQPELPPDLLSAA